MERKRIRNWVFEVGHDDGFSQRPDRSMGFAEKLRIGPVYQVFGKIKTPGSDVADCWGWATRVVLNTSSFRP